MSVSSNDGTYQYGAVASDDKQCSTVGKDIMARGGSAVDTAIATLIHACVVDFHNCGIGGGFIMTVYKRSEKKAYTINARETAPGAAHSTMFIGNQSHEGGLSIAVPGVIKGLWEAWKLGGTIPWAELFQPSINACRNGFLVSKDLAYRIETEKKNFTGFNSLDEIVNNPSTGVQWKEGEFMTLPKLANTLGTIANEGADAFYNGSLAHDIALDIQEAGGIITEEDLRAYPAVIKDPLKITIHNNYTVYSPPVPSNGPVLQFILGILNGYKFGAEHWSTPNNKVLTLHRTIEAIKFAFSKRSMLGDPDVEDQTFKTEVETLVSDMTSDSYTEAVRQQITDEHTQNLDFYGHTFFIDNDSGTSHISILAPKGDAVSVTTSNNYYFGSKEVGKRTGIMWNNEMNDFSTPGTTNIYGVPASQRNFIRPYKRPLSSMCPSIITDTNGDVKLVIGASGATKIPTGSAMTTMMTLWFGMTMKEAIDHKRLHHQLLPEEIKAETGFDEDILDGLRKKGHIIRMEDDFGCLVQGVLMQEDKYITACSDHRKQGQPDGF